ncbi:hypothetical protein [Streptomyces sp. AC555_RSS877]|uniref:hypothetical protein n=1 Tax=Streptomyces sp. AC555_RSS877 TaxID=2823688 RepID=UPI0020B7BDB8|nr:hypothetical protein [Streptomyces sp. AC555_RSS877]
MPAGETVTVRFDTHHSLNNADDWQPSLVTDVVADDPAVPEQNTLFLQHIQAALLQHFTEEADA